jgi:acyl-CoA reductase-like NAD-dependent aldehyde dehydrogenase
LFWLLDKILTLRRKQIYDSFYKDKPEPSKVGRIVNDAQWKRVNSLIASTKGTITRGGGAVYSGLFIEPTVVKDVAEDDVLLDTELFAPILPVVRYRDTLHANALLNSICPTPLGFYVFSEDLDEANKLVNTSGSGGAAINDVMAQIAPTSLPFGGFGQSGFGAYRGKASIDTFSHKQSVVVVPTSSKFESLLEWRYPYGESAETVSFIRAKMLVPLM